MKKFATIAALLFLTSACVAVKHKGPGKVELTNKGKAAAVIESIEIGNPEPLGYIAPHKYIQHDLAVGDGLAGFGEAPEAMAVAGTPMLYTKTHMICGEGNFVLAVSEGQFPGKHAAFCDLFCIESGKIVEHFDTIEEISAKELWKNSNGTC